MRGFVVIAGDLNEGAGRRLSEAGRRGRGAQGWTCAKADDGLAVFVRGPCAPALQMDEGADNILIGEVFAREGGRSKLANPSTWSAVPPARLFGDLTEAIWGRYVALVRRADRWSAYRDPSGGLECFHWTWAGLDIFASDIAPWLTLALPEGFGVDERRLANMIAAPVASYGACAIAGVTALAPGQALIDGRLLPVWSPVAIARGRAGGDPAWRMRRCVDETVASLMELEGRLGAEISGGLDSAIVAGAITAVAPRAVGAWLSFYIDEPLGDERRYARAVAERLGLTLTVAEKPEGRFEPKRQRSLGLTFRPPASGVDQPYDRLIVDHADAAGLDRLFSGQGGDTVFMQAPAARIGRDLWLDRGLRGLFSSATIDLARWTRRSVWSVAGDAFGPARLTEPVALRPMAFATPELLDAATLDALHPWLTGLEAASPAKRFQVHSLAISQRLNTASERARRVDCIHPLLMQPVMEFSLTTSAIDLTRGGRDRALARETFADRLPEAVAKRRSKGDGTAFFSRMVEASLPALRPLLLEGELVRRGLLDRALLEAMLTPEHLVVEARYPEFLDAAAIELWLSAWSSERARHRTPDRLATGAPG